jgi:hypothetical protein
MDTHHGRGETKQTTRPHTRCYLEDLVVEQSHAGAPRGHGRRKKQEGRTPDAGRNAAAEKP